MRENASSAQPIRAFAYVGFYRRPNGVRARGEGFWRRRPSRLCRLGDEPAPASPRCPQAAGSTCRGLGDAGAQL